MILQMKKIIVGLGNPGQCFATTRHNAGALLVEFLCKQQRLPYFVTHKTAKSLMTKGNIAGREVFLLLPQTYMNMSGEAVGKVLRYYQLTARDLLLVYDDLDLPLGKYLFSTKTPKVHQGVLSVQAALGQQSFTSLRLGIDERERPTRIAGGDYVLSNFTKEQLQFLEQQLFPQVCLEVVSQWL